MNYKQYEIPTKSDHITHAYVNVISTSLLSHICLLQCDLGTVFLDLLFLCIALRV